LESGPSDAFFKIILEKNHPKYQHFFYCVGIFLQLTSLCQIYFSERPCLMRALCLARKKLTGSNTPKGHTKSNKKGQVNLAFYVLAPHET
jgi:hypothetical protein